MKFYDPYYHLDPTKPEPSAIQGRSEGGRFGRKSILSHPDFEASIPLEASWWANGARKAWNDIQAMTGSPDALYDTDLFDGCQNEFSWRMIFEVLDAARAQARIDPADFPAIAAAAHAWLLQKQIETAKAEMDAAMNDKTASALDQSSAIDRWMCLNWENIPEAEL